MPVVDAGTAGNLRKGGALFGREIAVAGYWRNNLGGFCPVILTPILLHPWVGCVWSDLTTVSNLGIEPPGGFAAVVPPEAEGGQLLTSVPTNAPSAKAGAAKVVVVGHAGDARAWQCPATCPWTFVVDRVAWFEGSGVPLSTGLSLADGIVLNDFATDGRTVGEIDPRINGLSDGQVQFVRLAVGQPDRSDTFLSAERLLDQNGTQIASMWTLPDKNYSPPPSPRSTAR